METFDVNSILEHGDRGYFLEVDLEYPEHLQDSHNDIPLAPKKIDVPRSEWSAHTRLLADHFNMKQKTSGPKLMTTLRDKLHYVLHHENLKLYLRLGMRLIKLHRDISFHQSPFMKPYILMNNAARKLAKSPFEISLYKGYNNYIFGKTCYNVFNQIHLKLVSRDIQFQRLAARPTFHSCHVISEDLIGVEMKPATIVCDKPLYVGATVLDLSKRHMYSFYYDFLMPLYYDGGLNMLYTDTDSFYLQVLNRPEFYMDILKYERFYDRSAYPKNIFLHSDKRKRELGLMKDVYAEGHMSEFTALRSKMYAVCVETEGHTTNVDLKAKGIKKSELERLKFDMYVQCLQDSSITTHSFKQIRSFRHHLVTKDMKKVGLCSYDDKRYLLPCGIHSYAYGHIRTKDSNAQCRKCYPL